MNAEIVMIGTELLLGQIVDSNAAYIGRTLAENGIPLYHKCTVGDNRARIAKVLERALERADVVLTSGGLGPTEDDLTREAVSDVFGAPLEFHQDLYDNLTAMFSFLKRPMPENNKKQCYAPKGATVIPNPNGTAPGIICGDARGDIICMPGVPSELYAMLEDSVIPYIRIKHGMNEIIHHRVLKVCGVGESWVDSRMGDLMASLENPKIGVLASPDVVRIRISARVADPAVAKRMIDEVDAQVRERLPGMVMGIDDETLEGVIDALMNERGWTLAAGETFTGGVVAQRLTVASATCFRGSIVDPIDAHAGENLKDAARAFAEQVRERFGTSCALGIAADTKRKTVGGCFLTPEGGVEWEQGYPKLDATMQLRGAVLALERVRRKLLGVEVKDGR